jgi:hypothetical protein
MVDQGSLLHRVIGVNDNGRSDAPTAKDALGDAPAPVCGAAPEYGELLVIDLPSKGGCPDMDPAVGYSVLILERVRRCLPSYPSSSPPLCSPCWA